MLSMTSKNQSDVDFDSVISRVSKNVNESIHSTLLQFELDNNLLMKYVEDVNSTHNLKLSKISTQQSVLELQVLQVNSSNEENFSTLKEMVTEMKNYINELVQDMNQTTINTSFSFHFLNKKIEDLTEVVAKMNSTVMLLMKEWKKNSTVPQERIIDTNSDDMEGAISVLTSTQTQHTLNFEKVEKKQKKIQLNVTLAYDEIHTLKLQIGSIIESSDFLRSENEKLKEEVNNLKKNKLDSSQSTSGTSGWVAGSVSVGLLNVVMFLLVCGCCMFVLITVVLKWVRKENESKKNREEEENIEQKREIELKDMKNEYEEMKNKIQVMEEVLRSKQSNQPKTSSDESDETEESESEGEKVDPFY